MNTLRDQNRSLRIEKAVLISFVKNLGGALTQSLRLWALGCKQRIATG